MTGQASAGFGAGRLFSFVSRHFRVFALLSYSVAVAERIYANSGEGGAIYDPFRWKLTQYFVNYADHGFAKRAVIGTLLRPFTRLFDDPQILAFALMVAMNLGSLALILWLVPRFIPHRDGPPDLAVMLRAALVLGTLGLVQVVYDLGRFDMPVIALGLGVLALGLRGWNVSAGLVAGLAVLVHESFVVYLLPLILALLWQATAQRGGVRAAVYGVLPTILIAGCAAVLVLALGNSDAVAQIPYGQGHEVWTRGLIEVLPNLYRWETAVLLLYWAAVLVALFLFSRGNGVGIDLVLVASLAPVLLNLFGIDQARWLALGFWVVLISTAAQASCLGRTWPELTLWQRRALYLLCLPLGPAGAAHLLFWF